MKCLYCYLPLTTDESDFHSACCRKMFGTTVPPHMPYTEQELTKLAADVIRSQIAVPGVQPKLSIDIQPSGQEKGSHNSALKFTIVGLLGGYILKPPTKHFRHLPEVEDVTMHLAELAGIPTVPHSLIRLQGGSLAYITRRIDRTKTGKLHMEDMCQLTERLTEHKYRGSYEQILKALLKYSANPGLDALNFFEQLIFSFLTGNADMHLKNFSLISRPGIGYTLTPAYDMVASALVLKEDKDDLALTLKAKKRKLKKADFDTFLSHVNIIDRKSIDRVFIKFTAALPKWHSFIDSSFLPPAMKDDYHELIDARAKRLEL